MSTVMRPSARPNSLCRREFLTMLRALSGLVLIAGLPGVIKAEQTKKYGADALAHGWTDNPLAFIVIGEDDVVTIVVNRPGVGQGVRTGMPLIIADELEADWSKVRVVQAPADEAKFGNQDTDGSGSAPHFFEPLRRCGAAARTMLEQAAAAHWGVPVSEVRGVNHEVVHSKSGRKLGYGLLAQAAARLSVPPRESLRLKDPTVPSA